MNSYQKYLAPPVALVLVCLMLVAGAMVIGDDSTGAASIVTTVTEDGITYSLYDDNTATITSSNAEIVTGALVLPDKITHEDKEYTLTKLDTNVFKDNTGITSVTIPNTVTDINNSCFQGCTGLKSIVMPTGLTNIGQYAFKETGLVSIDIPSTPSYLPSYLFANCQDLESVTFHGQVSGLGSVFNGCDKDKLVVTLAEGSTKIPSNIYSGNNVKEYVFPDTINEISNYAFKGATFETYTVPDGVKTIGQYAFQNCNNLTTVVIPDGVTTINNYAFNSLKKLIDVNIPSSITTIGQSAFSGTAITSVTIPAGVTTLGSAAFQGCENLATVEFAEGIKLTTLPLNLFSKCSKLENVEIPASVTTLNQNVFQNCTSLTEITIPSTVTNLGNGSLFNGCTNLKTVVFEEGSKVTSIPGNCFYNCPLETINIPDSVKTIQASAFYGNHLTTLTIPDSVTSLGRGMMASSSLFKSDTLETVTIGSGITALTAYNFANCTALKTVTIKGPLTDFGQGAFMNCSSLGEITIPVSTKTITQDAFNGCSKLAKVTIPEGSALTSIGNNAFKNCSELETIDGNLSGISIGTGAFTGTKISTLIDGTTLIYVPSTVDSFVIPAGITEIGASAFAGCTLLTSLDIPSSVTKIGDSAFNGCTGLTSMAIPANVTVLGKQVFNGCTGLTSMVIPDTVRELGIGTFYGCKELTEVTLPSHLTTIPDQTFYNCTKLSTYTISENITSIGGSAFSNCSGLVSIKGGENVATLGQSSFYNCSNLENLGGMKSVAYFPSQVFTNCGKLTTVPISTTDSVIIGPYAFQNCVGLESVYLGTNVSSVDNYAFSGCSGLKTVVMKGTFSTSGKYQFANCSAIESVVIGSNTTFVASYCFQNCSNLAKVTFENGVQEIQDYAFQNCKSIETLELPKTLKIIGNYAFDGLVSLKNVVLPESLERLGSSSFRNCGTASDEPFVVIFENGHYPEDIGGSPFDSSNLQSLYIPINVSIPSYLLNNLTHLEELIVDAGVCASISSNSLPKTIQVDEKGCATLYVKDGDSIKEGKVLVKATTNQPLYIPADCVSISTTFFISSSFTEFIVEEGNEHYSVIDGCLVYNGDTLVATPNANGTIPEKVTKIGAFALANVKKDLVIPATIESIGYCGLESYSRYNVDILGDTAFEYPTKTNRIFNFNAETYSPEKQGNCQIDNMFILNGDAKIFISMNDYHANVIVTGTTETELSFKIVLDDKYGGSELTVKYGDKDIKDTDGIYTITPEGDAKITINGIKIDIYSVESETEGVTIHTSSGSKVVAGSEISFEVSIDNGFVKNEDFAVIANGKTLVADENGYYTIVVSDNVLITVTGVEAEKTFTVKFDTDGGDEVPAQTVVSGYCATPIDVSKDGFVFAGWYVDADCTEEYLFGKVTSDVTVYAKWVSEDDEACTIEYSATNGSVYAFDASGNLIESGDSVPAGMTVEFVYNGALNWAVAGWTVNGTMIDSSSNCLVLTVTDDVTITVDAMYYYSAEKKYYTDTLTPTSLDDYILSWTVNASEFGGDGYCFQPGIAGDYVYGIFAMSRTQMGTPAGEPAVLAKIDINTGKVVKTVTYPGSAAFYQYVCTGNGYILNSITGIVYDLDLEPVFKLDRGCVMFYYHDGAFYGCNDREVFKFIAEDEDATVSDNVQKAVWVSDITSYTTYGAQLCCTDNFMLFAMEPFHGTSMSEDRYMITIDYETGEVIDSILLAQMADIKIFNGFITYHEGTAYYAGYYSGVEYAVKSTAKTLAAVDVDENGCFHPISLRYFSTGQSSWSSSFVPYGDYGYMMQGPNFYVFDLNTMEIISENNFSVGGHSDISISVGYDGKVYIYTSPYSGSAGANVAILVHDPSDPAVVKLVKISEGPMQYGKDMIRYGSNGQIVFGNDSGYIMCYSKAYTVTLIDADNNTEKVKIASGSFFETEKGFIYYLDADFTEIFDGSAITGDISLYVIPVKGTTGDANWSFDMETGIVAITGNGATDDYESAEDAPWYPHHNFITGFDVADSVTLGDGIMDGYRFTVTFVSNDEIISEMEYDYGTAAKDIVVPADPTIESDKTYTYTFVGWDAKITDVCGNVVYTALFEAEYVVYTYTFMVGEEIVKTIEFNADNVNAMVMPAVPAKTNFAGYWDVTEFVLEDRTVTAVYEKTAWTLDVTTESASKVFWTKVNDRNGYGLITAAPGEFETVVMTLGSEKGVIAQLSENAWIVYSNDAEDLTVRAEFIDMGTATQYDISIVEVVKDGKPGFRVTLEAENGYIDTTGTLSVGYVYKTFDAETGLWCYTTSGTDGTTGVENAKLNLGEGKQAFVVDDCYLDVNGAYLVYGYAVYKTDATIGDKSEVLYFSTPVIMSVSEIQAVISKN